MTRTVERVYTRREDIERLAALIELLHEGMRVRLTLVDGAHVAGVVLARPGLQTFFDSRGEEGVNSLLRLGEASGDASARSYWLDDVLEVEPLPLAPP